SRGTPKSFSSANNLAKNVGCSISYYRTALGWMARWSPPFDNRLICWRKLPLSQRARRGVQTPIRQNLIFGWGTRIRSDALINTLSRKTFLSSLVIVGALWE